MDNYFRVLYKNACSNLYNADPWVKCQPIVIHNKLYISRCTYRRNVKSSLNIVFIVSFVFKNYDDAFVFLLTYPGGKIIRPEEWASETSWDNLISNLSDVAEIK